MNAPAFIAVDWGTTNCRAYRIEPDGAASASHRDGQGARALAPADFAAQAEAIRRQLGDLPLLCAGMAGSAAGWREAPYIPCPVSIGDLAGAVIEAEPERSFIVPGVSDPRGDVMRGEEVQILGAVAAGLAPDDALFCQPGTHSKWARVEQARITGFATAMTGEIFALLREHSLLRDFMGGEVEPGKPFRAGLAEGLDGGLLGRLFSVRAAALLGLRPAGEGAAFASGLLIGADVRESGVAAGARVHLLASGAMGALYATAIEAAGARPVLVDGEAAFIAGAGHIWRDLYADAS